MSVLIWVQTVFLDNQQKTLVGKKLMYSVLDIENTR